ncbi:MAG TPA: STAS domain-containing protein [Candidatus Acidoferrales bacterium]|nr:STAS domain-containing protein [Candidatus Acidoferrales bacterium]
MIKAVSPAIINVTGDIDLAEMIRIKHKIIDLADHGQVNVILNIKSVDAVSFFAVGGLIGLLQKLRNLEGDLKIACASDFVTRIFQRAGAEPWIESYASVEDAVGSFDDDWAGAEGTVH